MYSDSINNLKVLRQWNRECLSRDSSKKPWISERECLSAWRRAGSHVDIHGNHIQHVVDCRGNTKITHIVASISFWTRWLGLLCLFKWVLTSLKPATLYFSTPSTHRLLDDNKIQVNFFKYIKYERKEVYNLYAYWPFLKAFILQPNDGPIHTPKHVAVLQ